MTSGLKQKFAEARAFLEMAFTTKPIDEIIDGLQQNDAETRNVGKQPHSPKGGAPWCF